MRSPREEVGLGAAVLTLRAAVADEVCALQRLRSTIRSVGAHCWIRAELTGDSPKSSLRQFLSHSQA